eukprot:TRINITY_DN4260_c0_g1_i1.p2 TRINITY_DN4260_c0_g1~~TRINITY_DN4260_c0_g1_i1.p2  ORF type:complete len:212 (-),score=61.73 TRINITY_DN4260_c0_g1_i1:145-780(-)
MVRANRSIALSGLVAVSGVLTLARWCSPSSDAFLQGQQQAATRRGLLTLSAGLVASAAQRAQALEPCPPSAHNCFSTASTGANKMEPWVWPAGVDKEKAKEQLKDVLAAYPKEGQNDADKGGWELVDDQLAANNYARVEYKSGLGNFAKFFNGGKPFIDDLEVFVGADNVQVRSKSRTGDSDFGVNGKRLNYISAGLREKGWTAKDVNPNL